MENTCFTYSDKNFKLNFNYCKIFILIKFLYKISLDLGSIIKITQVIKNTTHPSSSHVKNPRKRGNFK